MQLDHHKLLAIINVQSEISKLGLDLNELMTFVTQKAQALTNAKGAVVELAEGDEMVYRAVAGSIENQLGLRLKRNASLSGLCVEMGVALKCDDSELDLRVDRQACRKVGLRSMIVVPLKHRQTVVGALKVFSATPGAFCEGDVQTLTLMSDLIASAMHYSTQYDSNQLFHRATHDSLTDLGNRALFYDRLRYGLEQARRSAETLGIVLLDMDGLKKINDTYGHRAGDAAIKEFALRLKEKSRKSDTFARLGGDEFGVILFRIQTRVNAELYIQQLKERFDKPFQFEKHELSITASIGLSFFPEDGSDPDGLVDKADQEMYVQKAERKKSIPSA